MLARSGGTAIAKCLAVMPGVALLSEVNPAVTALAARAWARQDRESSEILWSFDPIRQADRWHHLITPDDFAQLRALRGPMPFEQAIALIHRRARDRGLQLILRDWSHIDFLGIPFIEKPPCTLGIIQALAGPYALPQAFTVRHPIDQWLSMEHTEFLKGSLTLEAYLLGCRRFAELAARAGFTRYEDFTADPDAHLRTLCDRLGIAFDPTYRDRWAAYQNITGDVKGTRAQARITALPPRPVDPDLLRRFAASEDYRATIEILGYPHRD